MCINRFNSIPCMIDGRLTGNMDILQFFLLYIHLAFYVLRQIWHQKFILFSVSCWLLVYNYVSLIFRHGKNLGVPEVMFFSIWGMGLTCGSYTPTMRLHLHIRRLLLEAGKNYPLVMWSVKLRRHTLIFFVFVFVYVYFLKVFTLNTEALLNEYFFYYIFSTLRRTWIVNDLVIYISIEL